MSFRAALMSSMVPVKVIALRRRARAEAQPLICLSVKMPFEAVNMTGQGSSPRPDHQS
jgi:hypothetical protein